MVHDLVKTWVVHWDDPKALSTVDVMVLMTVKSSVELSVVH